MRTHSTNGAGPEHPNCCDRDLCVQRGPDLVHRSAPARFIPTQRDTTEARCVMVSVERIDHVDETTGVQTVGAAEYFFDYGDGRTVRWAVEDFRGLAEMALNMHDHACRPDVRGVLLG